jgi:hypothetical protein
VEGDWMRKIPVSAIVLSQTSFAIEESDPVKNLSGANPVLSFLAGNISVDLTLADVQCLKALFGKAEKHLLLRKEQALRAKNLTLDFESPSAE